MKKLGQAFLLLNFDLCVKVAPMKRQRRLLRQKFVFGSIILFTALFPILIQGQSAVATLSKIGDLPAVNRLHHLVRNFNHVLDTASMDSSLIVMNEYKKIVGKDLVAEELDAIHMLTKYAEHYTGKISEIELDNYLNTFYLKSKKQGNVQLESVYYTIKQIKDIHYKRQSKVLFDILKILELSKILNDTIALHFSSKSLAQQSYLYQDYEKAIEYARVFERYSKNYYQFHRVLNYNLMAMSFQHQMQYDSAIYYHKICQNIMPERKDWFGICEGNIGTCYYLSGKFDDALPLLQLGLDTTALYALYDNAALFALKIGDIYNQQGSMAMAGQYFEKAKNMLYKEITNEGAIEYYTIVAKHHKAMGDYRSAVMANDSLHKYQALHNSMYDKQKKYKLEAYMMFLESNNKEARLEQEITQQKWMRNFSVFLGLLVIGGGVFYMRKRRADALLKEKILLNEKSLVENELNSARELIAQFVKNSQEKTRMISSMEASFAADQTAPLSHEQRMNTLNELKMKAILTDNDWKMFMQKFNTIYPDYIIKLQDQTPEPTQAELRFFCLSKLKLNNKEMADVLGVSPDAMRNTKSRLKKKYGADVFERLMVNERS